MQAATPPDRLPTLEDLQGIKVDAPATVQRSRMLKGDLALGTILRGIFSGTILAQESTRRQLPFVLMLVSMALLYIANSYHAERTLAKMSQVTDSLKKMHSLNIISKAELMKFSKQSDVAGLARDLGLEEPREAPRKIVTSISRDTAL
jgi:hypothetical protein